MIAQNSMGYSAGNLSDRMKHRNLESWTKDLDITTYVDFNAGIGESEAISGETYLGSPVRMIEVFHRLNKRFRGYFHEIDGTNQLMLDRSIKKRILENDNYYILGDWKTYVEGYKFVANEKWMITIDPTKVRDYLDYKEEGILSHLPGLLEKKAKVFLYVPQNLFEYHPNYEASCQVMKGLDEIKRQVSCDILEESKVFNQGFFKRRDHNIFFT